MLSDLTIKPRGNPHEGLWEMRGEEGGCFFVVKIGVTDSVREDSIF